MRNSCNESNRKVIMFPTSRTGKKSCFLRDISVLFEMGRIKMNYVAINERQMQEHVEFQRKEKKQARSRAWIVEWRWYFLRSRSLFEPLRETIIPSFCVSSTQRPPFSHSFSILSFYFLFIFFSSFFPLFKYAYELCACSLLDRYIQEN